MGTASVPDAILDRKRVLPQILGIVSCNIYTKKWKRGISGRRPSIRAAAGIHSPGSDENMVGIGIGASFGRVSPFNMNTVIKKRSSSHFHGGKQEM